MNKIRSKKCDIFLLVDCNGNFTEITYDAFCTLYNLPTARYESMVIRKHKPLLVEDDKTGEYIVTRQRPMMTVACEIDEYYADVFNNDALCELQRKITRLETIEFIIL